ncbi:MAP/microtubule affinity-regulating kinase 4-like isoform X1 [Eulemur rufifrons]|uniref:MAP/microtubule affinity-regulating kinase 4-like isoform X1 n=1 Tax=Eulemur rufifrons TaxID=859984 RepID=UPI0037437569
MLSRLVLNLWPQAIFPSNALFHVCCQCIHFSGQRRKIILSLANGTKPVVSEALTEPFKSLCSCTGLDGRSHLDLTSRQVLTLSPRLELAAGSELTATSNFWAQDTSCRDGLTFTSHTRGCHGSEQPVCAVVGNYRFLGSLGEGAYSTVKLARHVLTAREVAIKILDKTKCNLATLQMIDQEIKIMTMLHHPHIVQLYEVINSGTSIYLIMEYACHGDVYDYLQEVGRMYEDEAREKFRQVGIIASLVC